MKTVAKNIGFNLIGQAAVVVLALGAVRTIHSSLGGDALGIILFAWTINAILTATLDLGLSSTVVREVARAGRVVDVVPLIRTAASICWCSYLVLAIVLALCAGTIVGSWLNLGALDEHSATASLQILGAGSLLALPKSIYASLLRGLQRMDITNLIDVVSLGLQLAGTVVVVSYRGTLLDVSWWLAVSTAASLVAYATASVTVAGYGTLVPAFYFGKLQQHWPYAFNVSLVTLLALVQNNADKLIVSRLLPLETFGLYSFCVGAVNKGLVIATSVAQASFPALTALQSAGDHQAALSQYRRLQDLICYAAAVVFGVMPFVLLVAIDLSFGAEAAQTMRWPVVLLTVGSYMSATLHMPYYFALAAGKPEIGVGLNARALMFVLPVTVLATWFWGLAGASLSWVIYHIFAYGYMVPRVANECGIEGPAEWYRRVAWFVFPAFVVYAMAWYALSVSAHFQPMPLLFGASGATVIYVWFGWRLLSSNARHGIQSAFRSIIVRSDAAQSRRG